jgi:hypothetical protein
MRRCCIPFIALSLLCVSAIAWGAAESELTVELPAFQAKGGVCFPLDFPIPAGARFEPGNALVAYRGPGPDDDRIVDMQVSRLGPWKGPWDLWGCFFHMAGSGPAASVSFELVPTKKKDVPPAFRFEKAEDKYLRLFEKVKPEMIENADGELVRVFRGEQPVLTYNYGMLLKEGVPEDRRRSCYVHPVYGLNGEVLTDDFPADHFHHRGLCWVWPRVIVGGKEYDLWDIRGVEQRFERWLGEEIGPVCAVFGVQNGWYLGDKKIIDEKVWLRVFRAIDPGRAIDVVISMEPTKDLVSISGREPVKGYGGFSFRFSPREETVLTTPAGKEPEDSDLKPYPWADLSAKFAGSETFSGVALFDDVRNPRFPNGWTLRHYGFLGVAWPGLEFHTLRPSKPLTLQYRVYLHRGDAEEGNVAAAYAAYSRTMSNKAVRGVRTIR